MKKILLCGTAGAVLALAAGAAHAEIVWKLEGEIAFTAGFVDDDVDTDRGYDFRTTNEFTILADGVAESGLLYGGEIALNGSDGNVSADYANIYLGGSWGRLRLGGAKDAIEELDVDPPGVGGADGDFNKFVAGDGANVGESGASTGRDVKILYTTSGIDLAGFTLGASYAPTTEGGMSDVVYANPTNLDGLDAFEHIWSLGVRWDGSFGDVGVAASAGYIRGEPGIDPNVDLSPLPPPVAAAIRARLTDLEDLQTAKIGVAATYGGFAAGAQFLMGGGSVNGVPTVSKADSHQINLGASYATGPWTFGANYYRTDVSYLPGLGTQRRVDRADQAAGVGVSYAIAPGLSIQGDLTYFDSEFGYLNTLPVTFNAAPGAPVPVPMTIPVPTDANVIRDNMDNDGMVLLVKTKVEF